MKLVELKPTLQEALGFDWVFDLHESLNTRFDDESWSQVRRTEVGVGVLGDETFRIVLEPQTFPIDGIKYQFINVAFQKIVNGEPTEELQLSGKNASKIVGAISNALIERIQLYDFDAVLFQACDNVEARMTIYNKVADRKWTQHGLGTSVQNIDLRNGCKGTVLLSKELARQKLDSFMKFLKAQGKP